MEVTEMFSTGKEVLEKNFSIALFPVMVSVLLGAFSYLIAGGVDWLAMQPSQLGAFFGVVLIFMIVSGILTLIAEGVSIVMSYEALEKGRTSLSSGIEKTIERLGKLIATAILVGIVISLGLILFIIPGLLAMFFLMFAIAVVMLEDLSPIEAMKRSYSLVRANIGSAFVYVVAALLVLLLAGVIGKIFEKVTLVGPLLISPIISGIAMAYVYVVLTVFYTSVSSES